MNRILKFRVWDKRQKKFNYFNLLDDFSSVSVKNQTIQQFTGLLDKNKREIFEGDIVKCDAYDKYKGVIKHITGSYIVSSIEKSFKLQARFDELSHINTTSNVEIIGNIFENPN